MIAAIEDAIVAYVQAAAAASPGLGYKLTNVATYGGQLDEDLGVAVRSFPAVWVTYAGGGKPVPCGTSRGKYKVPATFVVMMGARNVRAERNTRHGLTVDGQIVEVGVYRLMHDIGRLLLSQDFGLGITRLVPGATRTLYNTKLNNQAMAVFAREWHTEFIETPPTPDDPDWLTLGIDYRLKPGDDVADASDEITLNP